MNIQAQGLDTSPDKDIPLKEDIRFLGRLLGDTVREQQGEEIFDLVETIRQKSVAYLRDENKSAKEELETILERFAFS